MLTSALAVFNVSNYDGPFSMARKRTEIACTKSVPYAAIYASCAWDQQGYGQKNKTPE